MPFRRRRGRPASPDIAAHHESIANGWHGLAWGTPIPAFRDRFPGASRTDSGWWTTGEGHEELFGISMLTQYSFNARERLCLVALYPEAADRVRLPAAMLAGLGAPAGDDTRWTIGDVTVDLKVASVAVTLTHRGLAAAGG